MSPRRLKIELVAASGLILLLLAAVAPAQDDPGQESVRRAVDKGKKLLKDWKIEEARSQFEQARIASNGQAPAVFVGLAEVELAWSNLERALQHADKALELTSSQALRAEILNLKGIIFFGYVRSSIPKDAVTAARPSKVEGLEEIPIEEPVLDPDEAREARFKRFSQEHRARAAVAETYFREALEVSVGSLNAARLNLAELATWSVTVFQTSGERRG